jgi:hypothetical protein
MDRPPARLIRRLIERSKLGKPFGNLGRCWEFQGRTDKDGYGEIAYSRKCGKQKAHRVAYAAFVGPIPDGLTVHHKCFNRCCINPDHLELETHGGNTAEANSRTGFRGNQYTSVNNYPEFSGQF